MTRRAVLVTLLLLGLPAAAAGQSLWRDGAAGATLFADRRARAVNDLVTIIIDEQSSSTRSANTTTSRDTSRTFGVNNFPTVFDPVSKRLVKPFVDPVLGWERPSTALKDRFNLDVAGSASHEGKGSIENSDRVTGRIGARVVKVLDNGNLVIEGRRTVLVNSDTQIITLSGVVRPDDIAADNTVHSNQIADAEVQMVGRGILSEAQRPGILYRILDWLRLF